jgi:hypothetical protein
MRAKVVVKALDHFRQNVQVQHGVHPFQDLQQALAIHRSVSTIREDSRRKPNSLPPRLLIPGSARLLWLESDVLDWIRSCSTAKADEPKRKVGRPVNPDYLRSLQKQLTTTR